MGVTYEEFAQGVGPKLRGGLEAAYGPEVGGEATADALAYAWQDWDRLSVMENPTGYLYRVGQSAARKYYKAQGYLPSEAVNGLPHFEPGLAPALESLSEQQRVAVILVHALGWPQTEAAELLNIDMSTLRTHLSRGLTRLRSALKVESHAS